MGSRVYVAVVLGILLGVFARSYLPLGFACVGWFIVLSCAALGCGFFDARARRSYIVCAVLFAALAIGILRMHLATQTGDPTVTAHLGETIVAEGIVSAEPDVRDSDEQVQIDLASLMLASTSVPVYARALAIVPLHSEAEYGDRVRVTGALALPQPFDDENGRSFDYPSYLAVRGIDYRISYGHVVREHLRSGNPLVAALLGIKAWYESEIADMLPEPEAGLAAGITVGDKRSIGPSLSADFQAVGLQQIIVLSGYNITIVIAAILALLRRAPRSVQFAASVCVVAFFVCITGGASSALRAGIMSLIALFARMKRRTFETMRALAFASVAMVLWNPFILAFDPGFQLSAIALIGLTLFTPLLSQRLWFVTERYSLREIVASTVATQFFVAPFILYQSGMAGVYAIPANVLVMPVVPAAMLMSCIAALAGVVPVPGMIAFAFPAHLLLAYIIVIGRTAAALPYARATLASFDLSFMIASYGLLCAALLSAKTKTPPRGAGVS